MTQTKTDTVATAYGAGPNTLLRLRLAEAIVVKKVQPTWFDVVLVQPDEPDVRLGTFFEAEVANRHRDAVIEGVLLAAREQAAAA